MSAQSHDAEQERREQGPSASPTQPRPLFIYGTLCAPELLAWALTGDSANTQQVAGLASPARVTGYKRYAVNRCDYPAVVEHDGPDSVVHGYLLRLDTQVQRKKLDNFEGDTYKAVAVAVDVLDDDGQPIGESVDADMYLWDGDMSLLSSEPWDLNTFITERLGDWLDLFEGVEMVGDDE